MVPKFKLKRTPRGIKLLSASLVHPHRRWTTTVSVWDCRRRQKMFLLVTQCLLGLRLNQRILSTSIIDKIRIHQHHILHPVDLAKRPHRGRFPFPGHRQCSRSLRRPALEPRTNLLLVSRHQCQVVGETCRQSWERFLCVVSDYLHD